MNMNLQSQGLSTIDTNAYCDHCINHNFDGVQYNKPLLDEYELEHLLQVN